MRFYRYGRWDGTQEIETFTAEDVMERIAEEMLDDGDLRSAMRRMLQRGAEFSSGRRMMGLQEMLDKLRQARAGSLDRYNLGSSLDDIMERLEKVIDTERRSIKDRLGEPEESPPGDENQGARSEESSSQGAPSDAPPSSGSEGGSQAGAGRTPAPGSTDPMFREIFEGMARKHLEQIDHLPPDVGGRIKELRDYDFMDPEARQQFEELMQMLQQQIMQSYFKGLQQSLQQMTPEAMRQMQQMVGDLNDLLEKHRRGEDTEDDFKDFMKKWGQFFPEGIENVEQLAAHMQKQMQQMESLLNSMTPEMREQIEGMVNALFQDESFQDEMRRLAQNLDRVSPSRGEPGDYPFSGDEPISLQEAMKLMGDMNSMDELERELLQSIKTNDASNVDSDEVGRLLGEEMRRMTEQVQQLTKMLEDAGLIQRKGKDWEITPRAARKIGQKALQDIFGKLQRNAFGDHTMENSGIGTERLEETKQYAYGDPFTIDATKSIMNALRRDGHGLPVKMDIDDFEIYKTESMTQCSTVIMLDMSYSMMMAGRFQAGRKVALALDSLIRSQFPRDNLYVVAFSYFVLTLRPEMLLDSYWVEYGGGTNFQEALRQSRLVLAKHKGGTKQIIMITDGQPTTFSNWSNDDDWGYSSRRSPRALEETLREVVRCTKDRITINLFMMERERSLSQFVTTMARLNHGRAFFSSPGRLGEYILHDYVNNKRKLMR